MEEIWGELQDDGGLPRDEEEAGSDIDEGTSLLRKPTSSATASASWRQARRGNYIMHRSGTSRSGKAPRERVLQDAIGGWWKLKWWKDPDHSGDGGGGRGSGRNGGPEDREGHLER